jgi:ubiquitin-protein ligase
MSKSIVPRNFKLLDELENGKNFSNVSYGTDDNDLETFTGSIIARNGNIYGVTIFCDIKYPLTPPQITFLDTNSLPNICDSDGSIKESISNKITWSSTSCYSIGDMLVNLEKYIH